MVPLTVKCGSKLSLVFSYDLWDSLTKFLFWVQAVKATFYFLEKWTCQIWTKKYLKIGLGWFSPQNEIFFCDEIFSSLKMGLLTTWYHSKLFVAFRYDLWVSLTKFLFWFQAVKVTFCFLEKWTSHISIV